MAYRVVYDSLGEENRNPRPKNNSIVTVTAILVICCVLCAVAIHAGALPWVRDVLLPGDAGVTAAALENMVTAILDGSTLGDAITAFCQEIMLHGAP